MRVGLVKVIKSGLLHPNSEKYNQKNMILIMRKHLNPPVNTIFHVFGLRALVSIKGDFNTAYSDFKIMQQIREQHFLFQRASDPVYRAISLKTFSQGGVEEVDWPAQSPDRDLWLSGSKSLQPGSAPEA